MSKHRPFGLAGLRLHGAMTGEPIVMAAVVAVALISATAALASSTLLSAPRHEAVAVDARASEAPVMPQSLGYLEFDWSTASGDVPGFAPLSSNSAAH